MGTKVQSIWNALVHFYYFIISSLFLLLPPPKLFILLLPSRGWGLMLWMKTAVTHLGVAFLSLNFHLSPNNLCENSTWVMWELFSSLLLLPSLPDSIHLFSCTSFLWLEQLPFWLTKRWAIMPKWPPSHPFSSQVSFAWNCWGCFHLTYTHSHP